MRVVLLHGMPSHLYPQLTIEHVVCCLSLLLHHYYCILMVHINKAIPFLAIPSQAPANKQSKSSIIPIVNVTVLHRSCLASVDQHIGPTFAYEDLLIML